MENFRLNNMNAIVVGGAGDFGRSMVRALVEGGIDSVVIIDVDESRLQAMRSVENDISKIYTIHADISNETAIHSSFNSAKALLDDKIDILINTAGIQRRYRADQFPLNEWNNVMSVNLTAVFMFMKLASEVMIKAKFGKIINVGSIMGELGGVTIAAYAASKGGVAQLSRSFCNDLAAYGINVNTIAPGYFITELNEGLLRKKDRVSEISQRIPQGRWGKPDDLMGITVFLCSRASDYINGALIPIDGGYTCR